MDGAAWLLLVAGVGVDSGWQPLADGSERYEYVVQVEPEASARLAAGHALPVVVDVPAEVQPIGRIRVVTGQDELPRQRLVTRLKPAVEGAETGGVELAQYSQPAANRYGAAPANPYPAAAASPPAAAAEAATAWNVQPDPSITPTLAPPSSQQLFGQAASSDGTSWNSGGATAAVADASAALDQAGQQIERAVAPVKEGFQQIDGQVRSAVGDLGQRTQNLMNELRVPFSSQTPAAAGTTAANGAAPAATAAPTAAGGGAGQAIPWNAPTAAAGTVNPLRAGTAAEQQWNNPAAPTAGSDQPPSTPPFANASPSAAAASAGGATVEWNPTPAATTAAPSGVNASRSAVAQPGATAGTTAAGAAPAAGDPWAGVPDPRTQPGGVASSPATGSMTDRPLPFGGFGSAADAGPRIPPAGAGSNGVMAGAPAAAGTTTAAAPAAVGSHMLARPADRPLDESAATLTPAPSLTPPATNPLLQPGSAAGGRPAATTPSPTPPWGGAAATPVAAQPASAGLAAPAGRDHTAAILFAWVLLTGSIAGNMYLFWSYLDVRQKYRSLVRKTARAVGSRFSAA